MINVSEVQTTPPEHFQTTLQKKVYQTLTALKIPFERVESDEVITMEDCAEINRRLNMKMVKTLFLCNRQKSTYYLFITCGNKPFRSKDFSAALGVARVSFAPVEQMEAMLGTKSGAATVFSSLLDTEHQIRIVIDRDVLAEEFYGCSDGTTTGYMKVKTKDICRSFLLFTGHTPTFIEV